MRKTLYAAFTGRQPVHGVWSWDKRELEIWMMDRKFNGEAFEDEHMVRVTVAMYDRMLETRGWRR